MPETIGRIGNMCDKATRQQKDFLVRNRHTFSQAQLHLNIQLLNCSHISHPQSISSCLLTNNFATQQKICKIFFTHISIAYAMWMKIHMMWRNKSEIAQIVWIFREKTSYEVFTHMQTREGGKYHAFMQYLGKSHTHISSAIWKYFLAHVLWGILDGSMFVRGVGESRYSWKANLPSRTQ